MILTKTKIVITLLLLSVIHAQAANVDFNSTYNNASEACNDKQINKDCKNMNESSHQCDSTKTQDGVANNETSTLKPCVNLKSDNTYVEPKFSTKRPRGQ